MKRLLTLSLLFLSTIAFGATTTPVQLLNPSGSTAGQAIVSTGPLTAPTWGAPSVSAPTGTLPIANGGTGATSASAARTNLGLGTSATVNTGTSGATVPLLNGANTWAAAQTFSVRPTFNGATPWDSANLGNPASTTGNLSQFALTTSAQLAAVLSDETGTGANVFATSPTLTTPNIVGTSTNNNAAAGSVGEYVTATGGPLSLTSSTTMNLTSISLTAGDWDVSGVIQFGGAGTTVITNEYVGISTTSATLGSIGSVSAIQVSHAASLGDIIPTPVVRLSLSATTTVYLVTNTTFNTSTATATGLIRARRVR